MDEFHDQSSLWVRVGTCISDAVESVTPLSNSSFTRNFVMQCTTNRYFVKLSERHQCLDSEADGLAALSGANAIRVPRLIANGAVESMGFLVVEHLDMQNRQFDFPRLARDLAKLHRATGPEYGWHRDNFLGATLQINLSQSSWSRFFLDNRLGRQFRLAVENSLSARLAAMETKVLEAVAAILDHHEPEPSLLHGDLWRGNCGFLAKGVPVIYDPAVYFGDRETDLAMTHLFGGFPESFHETYQREWPLRPGWQLRQQAYNLYHILNHLNLFGPTYLQKAEAMCTTILARAGC